MNIQTIDSDTKIGQNNTLSHDDTLYLYLIITVLLNDAIRFCSKRPISGDSYRTEIRQARQSNSVCAVGVFTAWQYWNNNRSEMSVNVNQYRSAIGVFNNRSFITTIWYFHVEETTTVGKFSLPFLAINIMVLSFFLLLHLHSLLSPKI